MKSLTAPVTVGDGGETVSGSAPVGSRLWLLSREKTLSSVVSRAQAYADEALAWLHKSGAATSVVCHAMRVGHASPFAFRENHPAGRKQTSDDFLC